MKLCQVFMLHMRLIVVLVLIASVGFAQFASTPLENNDIIKMAKAGLGDVILVAKIQRSDCHFEFSADAIIQLTKKA